MDMHALIENRACFRFIFTAHRHGKIMQPIKENISIMKFPVNLLVNIFKKSISQ